MKTYIAKNNEGQTFALTFQDRKFNNRAPRNISEAEKATQLLRRDENLYVVEITDGVENEVSVVNA